MCKDLTQKYDRSSVSTGHWISERNLALYATYNGPLMPIGKFDLGFDKRYDNVNWIRDGPGHKVEARASRHGYVYSIHLRWHLLPDE